MNIINNIKSYILNNDSKIVILDNKINIINYIDIIDFNDNSITIKCINKKIYIKGTNLVVSKLVNDEVLITGEFNNIEFRGI